MTTSAVLAGGRERVLHEALRLFGAQGFAGTSVRAIAAAADVCPANVIHHFQTKEGLRSAVDALLLDSYRDVLTAAARALLSHDVPLVDPTAIGGDVLVRAYLRRVLLDGGPASATLLTSIVSLVADALEELRQQGLTRPGAPLDYAAVQVVALIVGPIALGPLLPGFEEATQVPGTLARRAQADVDLLREGLLRFSPTQL